MADKVRKLNVKLKAAEPLEIEGGLTLPPGTYDAVFKEIGTHFMGKLQWTKPEYKIELSADEITNFGGEANKHLLSAEFVVTKQVDSGQLRLSA